MCVSSSTTPTCLVGGQTTGESEVMEQQVGIILRMNSRSRRTRCKSNLSGEICTTCAIGEDLNAYCWGNSETGKLDMGIMDHHRAEYLIGPRKEHVS